MINIDINFLSALDVIVNVILSHLVNAAPNKWSFHRGVKISNSNAAFKSRTNMLAGETKENLSTALFH